MSSLLREPIGSTLLLTLDRPASRNALDAALFDALTAALLEADADDAVRSVIITGSGSAFSAGYDLHEARRPESPAPRVDQSFLTIRRTTPLIAAVNGPAVGAGFELVLASDIVIATPAAWFAFPEAQLGLVAGGGGVWRLVQRVGHARAMAVAAAGDRIEAHEARAWGLVNRVVEAGELLVEAHRYAARLAESDASSVAETLRLGRMAFGDDRDLWERGLRSRSPR